MSTLLSRLFRLGFGVIAALSGLILLYLAAALAGALIPGPVAPHEGGRAVTIGLVSGPIHNDFLLPLDPPTQARFAFLEEAALPIDHPNAKWIMLGWGAKEFYTTVGSYQDVTAAATLRGIIGDKSVLRAQVIGAIGRPASVRWLELSQNQYTALLDGLQQSFGQQPQLLRPGAVNRGAFYTAEGHFNLLRTCNQWVGEQLRGAGLRFGIWTPIPTSIRLSLWRFQSDSQ